MENKLKPLQFVKTPKGQIALINEVGIRNEASISILGDNELGERCAWWNSNELTVIDNLPSLLSRNLKHPFSSTSIDKEVYPKINNL